MTYVEGELRFALETQNGYHYKIELSEDLTTWTEEMMVVGDGNRMLMQVNTDGFGKRFIRARAEIVQDNGQGGGGQ